MTKQKLTPWYPGTVIPIHAGSYQRSVGMRRIINGIWKDGNWYVKSGARRGPSLAKSIYQVGDYFEWRGIAK